MHEEITLSFFVTFSRFEYALKAAGKAKAGAGDAAEANWQEVEEALRHADAERVSRVRAKAGILLTDPPRKQVFTDGQLNWRSAGPAGDEAQNLVAAVKRVRNNLFHGGKYSPEGTYLSARSVELVRCVRAVLEELLQLPALNDVAGRFHGYDPQEG
jgi:hypothetical protein